MTEMVNNQHISMWPHGAVSVAVDSQSLQVLVCAQFTQLPLQKCVIRNCPHL